MNADVFFRNLTAALKEALKTQLTAKQQLAVSGVHDQRGYVITHKENGLGRFSVFVFTKSDKVQVMWMDYGVGKRIPATRRLTDMSAEITPLASTVSSYLLEGILPTT